MILEEAPESVFVTDLVLLRRVLVNLVKNAVEAISPGERVTVRAAGRRRGDRVRGAQSRSHAGRGAAADLSALLSTKEGHGRGVGTYSIRLFTERHLRGHVNFESCEPEGTTFRVRVPKDPGL